MHTKRPVGSGLTVAADDSITGTLDPRSRAWDAYFSVTP